MELRELAKQYKNDLDKLKVQIEDAKALRKKEESEVGQEELDYKINTLQDMYDDLYSTAEYLIKYYE